MSIEVHVRIRPSVGNIVWSSAETVLYSTANPNTRYVYNKVHPSNSTNESIFHGLEAIVHAAFDGKNVTVMAYGQTGSGKTHSMIGVAEDAGMVPRAARLLLDLKRHTPGTMIQAFYTEIYNESVKDLLEPQRGELALHDAPDGGVYFEKKMIEVQSFEDFIQLQAAAERNRKYGVTNLNEHSSRSHVILTFEITRRNRAGKSVLNMVDLAGSESAARANTEGLSLREGGFINRSLLTLGNVVDAIVERRPYIPYRDAKLTRILRTCLGGSGITLILCCVNPSRENFDQTVATLRFTQRAMRIKNDPVVVLNMPPLFTHQYSDGARQLIDGLQESADAEYQRGLRDSYVYCGSTIASVVGTYQNQVSDCLHALANGQRLLVAHDHAMAIDHIGRLYNQLNELTRQRSKNRELADSERKRQREVAAELTNRRDKLTRCEEELGSKTATVDTDVAGWEYQLYEARQKQCSELDVLVQSELARRARIQYEWAMCLERIASRYVPTLRRGLEGLREKVLSSFTISNNSVEGGRNAGDCATLPAPLLTPFSDDLGRAALQLKELRTAVISARDEVTDLEMAHEMVKDDIDEAKRQQAASAAGTRGSASVSPQPRPDLSTMSEAELFTYYREVPDEDVDERIRRLEREETALMAQARRGVRRESLRRVRESLRGSRDQPASRSPGCTGGVSITRCADTAAAGVAHRSPQKGAFEKGSVDVDAEAKMMEKEEEGGGDDTVVDADARTTESSYRGSSANYADGVKNALSILDGLKAQLQRRTGHGTAAARHASPTASSASRSQHTRRHRSASSNLRTGKSTVEETAVYHDAVGLDGPRTTVSSSNTSTSAVQRRVLARTTSADTENMTLAELYQTSVGKENGSRHPTSTATGRGPQSYKTVAADNAAFDVDVESPGDGTQTAARSTSPPIGIAARRKMERQRSRPAVERALYTLSSNSHSPSVSLEPRSRSRRVDQ